MKEITSKKEKLIVEHELETGKPVRAPRGYKLNPLYVEKKTQRVHMFLQPSVVEKVKALAKKRNVSMTEIFDIAIKEYLSRESKEESDGE